MRLTRNLSIFVVLNTISTIVFIVTLATGIGVKKISDDPATFETSTPFLYALFWLLSFLLLLRFDNVRHSRRNLGLQYHLAMTLILLAGLIFGAFASEVFRSPSAFYPIFALFASLLVHWFFTRNNLQGIEAKKVFR
ncbi:MAG TPA: hypothetical protein PKB15_08700 [Acidimicrobiia bacterium]|nr:hypothetical protein [Acidimicrobiia bacterium]